MSKRKIQKGKYYRYKRSNEYFYKVESLKRNCPYVDAIEINTCTGETRACIVLIDSLGREISKRNIEEIKKVIKIHAIDSFARHIGKINLF